MANTLSNVRKPIGATQRKTRRGRGVGSGLGKTAGRGQKGQFARNGVRREFEGGQTPLARRLPKRGFVPPFPVLLAEVNVGDLDGFDAGAEVDEKALRAHGLVKGRVERIKVLGSGDLKKKLTVTAHAFSKSAVAKIEKAGGKALLVDGFAKGTSQQSAKDG
jgi:large subunit ribosomal protein L15